MLERHFPGVQRHALESGALEITVQLEIAVFFISENWKAEVREMDPDLMRPSSLELRFEETDLRPARH